MPTKVRTKPSFYRDTVQMANLRIKDNARDVFLGHARQLVWKDILQPHKPEQNLVTGVSVQSVTDDVELDDATFLLQTSCLITRSVGREQTRLQHTQSRNHTLNSNSCTIVTHCGTARHISQPDSESPVYPECYHSASHWDQTWDQISPVALASSSEMSWLQTGVLCLLVSVWPGTSVPGWCHTPDLVSKDPRRRLRLSTERSGTAPGTPQHLRQQKLCCNRAMCAEQSPSTLTQQRHHRLNGSSSPVLTATSLSYGKAKNLTPHRIKTPDLTEIEFGRVDYVGEGTRHAKFYANPYKGASRQMGEIYAKIFLAVHIPFFQKLTYRSDPSADFRARWLKRRGLAQGCAFWGLKNLKLIFNVFIQKIQQHIDTQSVWCGQYHLL